MSVIVGRALPDVRDGFKTGASTCAFLHGSIWHHCRQKIRKICPCGRCDVIGKYHPHGDSAVYDTIVAYTAL